MGKSQNQAENVLCDFDKDIEAYKARESKRTRFTIACAFAIIAMQKTFFHVFLSLLVRVNFCGGRQKSWRRITSQLQPSHTASRKLTTFNLSFLLNFLALNFFLECYTF